LGVFGSEAAVRIDHFGQESGQGPQGHAAVAQLAGNPIQLGLVNAQPLQKAKQLGRQARRQLAAQIVGLAPSQARHRLQDAPQADGAVVVGGRLEGVLDLLVVEAQFAEHLPDLFRLLGGQDDVLGRLAVALHLPAQSPHRRLPGAFGGPGHFGRG